MIIIVDMLNDFFREEPLLSSRSTLVSNINRLIGFARRSGLPIIWVRQEFTPDLSDAFLGMRAQDISITIAGTEGCKILQELHRTDDDTVIVKKRYSAFFQTDLDELTKSLKPEQLIICGVNTHACIRTTAIDAYQRDLNVIIPIDCVNSSDREHHNVSLKYLGKEICRLSTVDEIIDIKAGRC